MNAEQILLTACFYNPYVYSKAVPSIHVDALESPEARALMLALKAGRKHDKTPFMYEDPLTFINEFLTPQMLVRGKVVENAEQAELLISQLILYLEEGKNLIEEQGGIDEDEIAKIINNYILKSAQSYIKRLSESRFFTEDILKVINEVSARYSLKLVKNRQKDLREVMEEVIESLANPQETIWKAVPTGFPSLDEHLDGGFRAGEVIVIAGMPGAGKTSFALNILLHTIRAGKKPAFFSLEVNAQWIAMRLLVMLTKLTTKEIKYAVRGYDEYAHYKETIQNALSFIPANIPIYDTGILTVDDIVREAQHLYDTTGLDIVFIDYLQLIRSGRGAKSEHAEISDIIKTLKETAKALNIPFVVLSQFNRNVRLKNRVVKPDMGDLRGSGMIEATADVIMTLITTAEDIKKEERPVTLSILKARHARLGDIDLMFHGPTYRFWEANCEVNCGEFGDLSLKEEEGGDDEPEYNTLPF